MKILFLGVQFEPEITGAAPFNTGLCKHLHKQGHEVTAIVGFPSFPEWEVRAEYRGRWFAEEDHDGVRVLRVWQYVPRMPTTLRRVAFDTTITITSVLAALRVRRPDVIIATCSPLQLGASAALLGALWRRPFLFHLQDLLPESATEIGMLTDRRLVAWTGRLADAIYRRATKVSAIGHGMLAGLRRRGVPEEKLAYLPNWIDVDRFRVPDDAGSAWRRKHGIAEDAFVVMYIGNFGFKQDMATVARAAALLTDCPEVEVVLVGDGADRPHVTAVATSLNAPNLHLLPVQPAHELAAMTAAADVFVLHQKRDVLDMVVPSKLLTYSASAKPTILAGSPNSGGAAFMRAAEAGLVVKPESPEALARAIRALRRDPEARRRYGESAHRHVAEFFNETYILAGLENLVTEVAGQTAGLDALGPAADGAR